MTVKIADFNPDDALRLLTKVLFLVINAISICLLVV